MRWVYGMLALMVVSLLLPPTSLSGIVGLIYLLAWYQLSGRVQVEWVKAHHGDQYPRKSWLTPVLIGIALVVLLMFVALLVGTLRAGVMG